MADLIDKGCELEQQIRERAINNHITRVTKVSDGYCIDCGDLIPKERLRANIYAQRCFDCQEDYELKLKQQGGKRA